MLVKKENIHEGIWGVYAEFGLKAANVGQDDSSLFPTAIVPLMKIGIQRFEAEDNLSVDAGKVNPPPARKSRKVAKKTERSKKTAWR